MNIENQTPSIQLNNEDRALIELLAGSEALDPNDFIQNSGILDALVLHDQNRAIQITNAKNLFPDRVGELETGSQKAKETLIIAYIEKFKRR